MNKTTDTKQAQRRKLALQAKYAQRITIAKQARELFFAKDYVAAANKYTEFLAIYSEINEVSDIYSVTPAMFDHKTQLAEMLLISHAYWELARIYEKTPKLQKGFTQSLNQFVRFTINQPYQVLNAEMLRKYIKKNKNISTQISYLNGALSQIYTKSKKCYIATLCFGETHHVTNDLRRFKRFIMKYPLGFNFISAYYSISSRVVEYLENKSFLRITFVLLSKPLIRIAHLISRCIIK